VAVIGSSRGYLCLVLHAHLPFVRHPEHATFLEEDWLYEAVTECYLPLLARLHGLVQEGVRFRLALSVSPTLAAMLSDPLLCSRYEQRGDRLRRLAEQELERTRGTPFAPAASALHGHLATVHRFWDRWNGDVLSALRRLEEVGCLEILTSTATHGFLPLMCTEEARRAQVHTGVEAHERMFGRRPGGIWLAECGYGPGVDRLLAEAHLDYFFCESAAVLYAHPRPRFGVFAPVATPAGPLAFARDPECGRQVWSSTQGYPGDHDYREYYRDLGFDASYDYIRPFLHADGVRRHLGFKYFRVTGTHIPLHLKRPYDPAVAAERAIEHARHFVGRQRERVGAIEALITRPPVLTAPYDAELFGHWWFEGPAFLEAVIREIARDPVALRMVTPKDLVAGANDLDGVELNPSSWGREGSNKVWLNGSNAWMYRHLHRMERRMAALAAAHPQADRRTRRILDQAARELLLAQSSDWAFIITNRTAVSYAIRRFQSHVERFTRLDDMATGQCRMDAEWLEEIESRDSLFPGMDYRVYGRGGG